MTISVGPSQRLFAAHEDILNKSPYFAHACRAQFFEASGKQIDLSSEDPEIFSAVLEYLYKGDYTPKLVFDKKRVSWSLDDDAVDSKVAEGTVYGHSEGGPVLKDTVIYVRSPFSICGNARLELTHHSSAPPTATLSPSCSDSLSRSKGCSLACSAARYWHLHASRTLIHLRATRS